MHWGIGNHAITLDRNDLKMLAAVSNGRYGVLLNSDYPWRESLDPDLTDIANEETDQTF